MRRDVRNWIGSCDACLKRKCTKQKNRHSLTKWKPSHPFWQVSFNIMGPIPESQGKKYNLLIDDQFSKLLHDSPSAGHFGIEKTYKRLAKGFIGPA